MFYVIKGRLYIEVEKNNYDLTDVTELFQGQHTSVKPNEFHRFFTKDEPVEALEVYYLNSISEDIVRKTVGGVEIAATHDGKQWVVYNDRLTRTFGWTLKQSPYGSWFAFVFEG